MRGKETFTSEKGGGRGKLRAEELPPPPVLEAVCRKLCEEFGAAKVYVAKRMGYRNHFLAGWGRETFSPPSSAEVGEDVVLFVVGEGVDPKAVADRFLAVLEEAG